MNRQSAKEPNHGRAVIHLFCKAIFFLVFLPIVLQFVRVAAIICYAAFAAAVCMLAWPLGQV